MYTFIEDEKFKNMIEKTIVFYIFHKTVKKESLIEIDFDKFVKITQEKNFLNMILVEMGRKKIDIFKTGVEKVTKIIEEIFVVQ